MAFRNIMVESPAHLSIRNSQLVIRTDTEYSVALEDISAILLESRQSTITAAALSQLGQCGCAVFFCDEKHMPCAVLEPYHQYVRELSVLRGQLELSELRKKTTLAADRARENTKSGKLSATVEQGGACGEAALNGQFRAFRRRR